MQGTDINSPDDRGVTPMHAAAVNNAVDTMEWLGSDSNMVDTFF